MNRPVRWLALLCVVCVRPGRVRQLGLLEDEVDRDHDARQLGSEVGPRDAAGYSDRRGRVHARDAGHGHGRCSARRRPGPRPTTRAIYKTCEWSTTPPGTGPAGNALSTRADPARGRQRGLRGHRRGADADGAAGRRRQRDVLHRGDLERIEHAVAGRQPGIGEHVDRRRPTPERRSLRRRPRPS